MDARIIKTKESLREALCGLLTEKPDGKIKVEELLEKSGISRSTFYAHYKTVDDLVASISDDIFRHVFSHSLKSEKTHDFSHTSIFDTSNLITHVLYHLQEEKELIRAVLLSKYAPIFSEKLREEFRPIASSFSSLHPHENIPLSLEIEKTTEDFLLTLNYWISQDFSQSPQEIGTIYFALIQ